MQCKGATPGSSLPVLNAAYADLTERFYRYADPVELGGARLARVDIELAGELGLDISELISDVGLAWLGGITPGMPRPITMAYSGHQFGRFSRMLGDGRSIIVGQMAMNGSTVDLALKGSGPTPFTSRGDGYLSLESAVREFEMAQRLKARGLAAARVLAIFATGRTIQREAGPVPAGILVRLASSHIRIGTFEYIVSRRDIDALSRLVQCTLRRYPAGEPASGLSDAQRLLTDVAGRHGRMVRRWMEAGFAHGMLNTDNVLLSDEAMDFATGSFVAPADWRAIPIEGDPSLATDERYLLGSQPAVGRWNLQRLGLALSPLLASRPGEAAQIILEAIHRYKQELLMPDHKDRLINT